MRINLIGGDDLVDIELDERDVPNLGPGRQPRLGYHEIRKISLAASRPILRRQEPREHIRRQTRERINRLEPSKHLPRRRLNPRLDLHLKRLPVVGHVHSRLIILAVSRHADDLIAKPNLGQLKRGPVKIGVQLIGDDDLLSRCRRGRVVLEVDAIWK